MLSELLELFGKDCVSCDWVTCGSELFSFSCLCFLAGGSPFGRWEEVVASLDILLGNFWNSKKKCTNFNVHYVL